MDQDKTLQDVLETVQFIKEHGSTKEEMHAMGNGLREEMHAMGNGLREEMHAMGNGLREEMLSMEKRLENTIIEHVDKFIGLHQKVDMEVTAIRAKMGRMEEFMRGMAKHVQFDGQMEI